MTGRRREVHCQACRKRFWVEATDPRLPEGPFSCGTCDLSGWDDMAVFTGPAEMILVEESGGSSLLEVLDSFGPEQVRVVVYRRKNPDANAN